MGVYKGMVCVGGGEGRGHGDLAVDLFSEIIKKQYNFDSVIVQLGKS